ncbi:MAG: hypothetical protein IPM04_13610 [Saprospiraceae bacterium]|nr:hypothetical protein [Candidatus Brachybacter algidus]MBK8748852.1 hypothetical protein [Candidatus Brachybacter algidus]
MVAVAGLKGKWLKLESLSSNHITRSKKQSWGNNYTIEFDLLIVKKTYDPRIDFALINTGGNLVTDEAILRSGRNEVIVGLILGDDGKKTRLHSMAITIFIILSQTACRKILVTAILFQCMSVCVCRVKGSDFGGMKKRFLICPQ